MSGSERRRLWACTGVTRQMQRIAAEHASPGATCVVRYDLENGHEQKKHTMMNIFRTISRFSLSSKLESEMSKM